jgi:hypothetical protein
LFNVQSLALCERATNEKWPQTVSKGDQAQCPL